MLLRTRITLFLSVALLLVIGALIALGSVRGRLEQERLADIAIAGQRSLWDSLVARRVAELDIAAAALAARLATGAPGLAPAATSAVLEEARDILPPDATVQVLDREAKLVAANAPVFRSRPLLGPTALAALARAPGRPLGGLRQERPDRFVVAAARAVATDGSVRGAVSVAFDAATVLDAFTNLLDEPSYLVSLRGRMVAGTDPALWRAAAPDLPPRTAAGKVLAAGDRLYFAAAAPVADLADGTAGTLVTLRDATENLRAIRHLERTGLLAVAAAALVAIVGLFVYLRRAFSPLETTFATLDALSKGDLAQPPDLGGETEIRRIGEALTVFRRNALTLVEQEERIARQRRRQERVIRRQLLRLADTLDPEGRAEILSDLNAVMADPAPAAGTGARARRGDGDGDDLAVLAQVLQRMSQRITDQHHRLTDLIKELQDAIVTRARLAALEQELDIARELQLSFLPRPLPATPHFRIHGLMEPAKEVGGDFFDYFMIDEARLGLVVADVSGKGVPAALFMAISRTLIKAAALAGRSPAATIGEVNAFLAADNDQMMFVTVFHGVLDLASGVLTYVNAGHNAPLLCAAGTDRVAAVARTGDPALAVVEGIAFAERRVRLSPGDTLFLFTDGVTEAFNTSGEAFGDARLAEEVARHCEESVAQIDQRVREAVLAFELGAVRTDDLTCVCLRYLGADGGAAGDAAAA